MNERKETVVQYSFKYTGEGPYHVTCQVLKKDGTWSENEQIKEFDTIEELFEFIKSGRKIK